MANCIDRFWEQVDSRHSCWLWTGSFTKTGYGSFTATYEGRKYWKAHRFSWHLHNGPIPEGMCVLHKCDNRFCVNPDHLEIGTQIENCRHRLERGRSPFGERHGKARLTEADILAIHASDESHEQLARKYGVNGAHIGRIRSGERWGHLKPAQNRQPR